MTVESLERSTVVPHAVSKSRIKISPGVSEAVGIMRRYHHSSPVPWPDNIWPGTRSENPVSEAFEDIRCSTLSQRSRELIP